MLFYQFLLQQSQQYSMSFRDSKAFAFGDKNRTTIFPSLKKTFYDHSSFKSRGCLQMSLDQKSYRMTSNQILKGLIRHNDNEIKNLRTTFMRQNFEEKTRKKIGQYEIIRQIGKGGFAQVYQVEDANHNKYALKQYNLQNALECFHNQSTVGDYFFDKGQVRKKFADYQGKEYLIKFVDKFRIGKYGYIIQQLCGNNFSKIMSEIQGVFHNNQRIYQVKFKDFYKQLSNQNYLKKIMIELCSAVKLVNDHGFIHCDLKLENLMIEFTENIPKLKLIDFGSTFQLANGLPKITITPQYMPPQLLLTLENGSNDYQILKNVDVWSIGCILLEIVTGIPLWFRYKCRVEIRGKSVIQLGFFALTGRQYGKIIRKQREMVDNLGKIPFTLKEFDKFRAILKKLLILNPTKRISLQQCIQHLEELE